MKQDTERHEFQAEVKQLLDLMIHSLYSDRDMTFRDADTIARFGGDEFIVFSIDATAQDPDDVADRLSVELARANETTAGPSRLRWSVGHVRFDGAAVDSLDRLISEADRRMYAIKRTTQLASIG